MVVKKSEDISRRVVVIMLIVAIVTSLLGTWTVISTINSITVVKHDDQVTGLVGVAIAPDPNNPYHKQYFEQKEDNP